MSRAIITHFDGDPFTLNAWLTLYQTYWRGECDKIYISVAYNNKVVTKEIIDYYKHKLAEFPEIVADYYDDHKPPEWGNAVTLPKVTEEYIGLIESDGYVYAKGIVDQCFRLLENDGQDIVAPKWQLIDDPYIKGDLQCPGFMRCFFFTKRSILEQTDYDFMPRTIPAGTRLTNKYTTPQNYDLDCFGWMSWQLALIAKKIVYTPANICHPDTIMSGTNNFKWVHVRQMSSSALGMGGSEFGVWSSGTNESIRDQVMRIFNQDFPGGPAEFTIIKALAFKLLFWDMLKDKDQLGQFAQDYRQILETVIDYYAIPRHEVYEIKGYYKGLFNI